MRPTSTTTTTTTTINPIHRRPARWPRRLREIFLKIVPLLLLPAASSSASTRPEDSTGTERPRTPSCKSNASSRRRSLCAPACRGPVLVPSSIIIPFDSTAASNSPGSRVSTHHPRQRQLRHPLGDVTVLGLFGTQLEQDSGRRRWTCPSLRSPSYEPAERLPHARPVTRSLRSSSRTKQHGEAPRAVPGSQALRPQPAHRELETPHPLDLRKQDPSGTRPRRSSAPPRGFDRRHHQAGAEGYQWIVHGDGQQGRGRARQGSTRHAHRPATADDAPRHRRLRDEALLAMPALGRDSAFHYVGMRRRREHGSSELRGLRI
mmetsp:Transcript_1086/g.3691  ORF Transcript_1086/g.3691 Transcript_1086/m.3691 type:complete len:319 (+) Transcript_1086:34-990(+)